MSVIPTKQIDGDVAVGRNVSAGGDANVQGNARIGHDLVVEGWLEAKNIKSANKGLFATVEALRAAYPHVHEGWFAGVPATGKEISDLGLSVEEGKALYRMYIGCGGEWVCEPLNKLYEITVDNRLVDIFREELTTLRDDHDHLETRVEAAETQLSDVETRLASEETRAHEKDEELAASIATETSRAGVAEQMLNDRIAQLKQDLDALDHENASEAIESFREILAFLEGISDDETLLAKLTEIKRIIDAVATNSSRADYQLQGNITSETNRATAAETALEERIDEHDNVLESFDEDIRALYDGANAHQRQFMQVEGKFANDESLFTHLSRTANVDSRPRPGALVVANVGDVWQLWQYRYNMPDQELLPDAQSEQLPDAQAQEHGEGDVEATALPPVAPDLNIADASNWVRIATAQELKDVYDTLGPMVDKTARINAGLSVRPPRVIVGRIPRLGGPGTHNFYLVHCDSMMRGLILVRLSTRRFREWARSDDMEPFRISAVGVKSAFFSCGTFTDRPPKVDPPFTVAVDAEGVTISKKASPYHWYEPYGLHARMLVFTQSSASHCFRNDKLIVRYDEKNGWIGLPVPTRDGTFAIDKLTPPTYGEVLKALNEHLWRSHGSPYQIQFRSRAIRPKGAKASEATKKYHFWSNKKKRGTVFRIRRTYGFRRRRPTQEDDGAILNNKAFSYAHRNFGASEWHYYSVIWERPCTNSKRSYPKVVKLRRL